MFRSGTSHRLVAGIATLGLSALIVGVSAGTAVSQSTPTGEVNWWSWTPDNNVGDIYIEEFNKEYPDIKVTYKKLGNDYPAILRPALASDDGPDVFTLAAGGAQSSIQQFGSYALDLTPSAEALLGSDWKDKISSTAVEAYTVDGELRAMPYAQVGAGNMWINQDLFDEYGASVPTNMEEWKSVCEMFRSEGFGCFAESINVGFDLDTIHSIANSVEPGLWSDLVAGKRKWTEPGYVEALRILQEMGDSGIIDEGATGIQQYPDINNSFLSGNTPMVQMGTWYAQYTTVPAITAALEGAGVSGDTEPITISTVDFPDVAGLGNPSTMYFDPDAANAVNLKSKNQDAAITFALWLGATQAGAAAVGESLASGTVLEGAGPDWDSIEFVNPDVNKPQVEAMLQDLQAATELRNFGFTGEMQAAVVNANAGVYTHAMTPEEAAESLQKVQDSQE